MSKSIRDTILTHNEIINKILEDDNLIDSLAKISNVIKEQLLAGRKILFCGNGGSASDAQHLSAELAGRFYLDRPALHAEALHVNTSYLTAVANDLGFEKVYERALEAKAKKGDVLVAISTSGNSENILNAIEKAREIGMISIAMTGNVGIKMANLCDYSLVVPSADTPRIQEAHILLGHIICQKVESSMFG